MLAVTNRPSVWARELYRLGQEFYKEAADPVTAYNLAGTLYRSQSGWLLLSVSNTFVRGLFSMMKEPGVELPLKDGKLEAHISVMRPEELTQIGGADKVTERGKQYHFSLGRWQTIEPDNAPGIAKVWYVKVHSPELQALRRSYGLSSLPNHGQYDFHISVAVLRRGVLGRNDTRKSGVT